MSDEEQAPSTASPVERPRYRQLTRWERSGAIAAGTAIAATGFVAMFKTDNEAGVAVAVVIGALFLILGIQGTQLGKLGAKDFSAEIMVREEERGAIAQASTEIAQTNPAQAQALLEGYQIGDPDARSSPAVAKASDYVYEQSVVRALELAFPGQLLDVAGRTQDVPFESRGLELGNEKIAVVISGEFPLEIDLSEMASMVADDGFDGLLIVYGRSDGFRYRSSPELGVPVQEVHWRWVSTATEGRPNTDYLVEAVRRLRELIAARRATA